MKKHIFLFILILCIVNLEYVQAQAYLGYSTSSVNFREGPSTEYEVIRSLSRGEALFVISKETTNNFYNVIDIATNKEGYVHKSYVYLEKELPKNEEGIFSPIDRKNGYEPTLKIFNNTDLTLTLRLNSTTYSFEPYERKSLTLMPGSYTYRASAPGVLPDYGDEEMKSNMIYEWEFYIVTGYR